MRTTIDKAGRLVLPKALRDQVGMTAGEVDVTVVGTSIVVEVAEYGELEEEDGHLYLPRTGVPVTAEEIRELRLGLQR